MSELLTRKQNRLKGYDYSQNGAYFVTICTYDKREILWNSHFVGARIARPPLSDIGEIVKTAIESIQNIYKNIVVDKYVIMPNHIHLILIIDDTCGRAMRVPTISTVINQMKGYISKQIGCSPWQRSYHDHIIRNETKYQKIWQYIDDNPAKWIEDEYYK